ncbi:type I methionyl aminopeptidase [Alicyclobacillus ferrooxydans]|uniref:type I methionyl aminopeptidase n=1 Tax=Alicyclobacillus ferrooxydans TaxID=471514 RepID=UPI0009F89695|nr:type I methionyl aminopeptidase [Alicyclobacillus ferrooxydans]
MIYTKSKEDINLIREACQINALVHETVAGLLEPGISTKELDAIAEQAMTAYGGRPSFREEYAFPGAICVSVNDEIGHGVPGERVIQTGDVVKVDVGVQFAGFHSDCAKTHLVGDCSVDARHLVSATKHALDAGLAVIQPDVRLSDVSHVIGESIAQAGLAVVKKAQGHGIGLSLHEAPQIPNYGPPGHGPRLRSGMVLAIEPVVVAGEPMTFIREDGWTEVTRDGSFGAHFEHTVHVHDDGVEILTVTGQPSNHADEFQKRFGLTWRKKKQPDDTAILSLAKQEMDPILLEAWGRPVQPMEVLYVPETTTYVLVDQQNHVRGFCVYSLRPPYLHINTIVLDAQLHGSGLATSVLDNIVQQARAKGMAGIELWVQTNNQRAIRFYEKSGFVYVGHPYFRTWAMRKRI